MGHVESKYVGRRRGRWWDDGCVVCGRCVKSTLFLFPPQILDGLFE
jgi:hypothetical protein